MARATPAPPRAQVVAESAPVAASSPPVWPVVLSTTGFAPPFGFGWLPFPPVLGSAATIFVRRDLERDCAHGAGVSGPTWDEPQEEMRRSPSGASAVRRMRTWMSKLW